MRSPDFSKIRLFQPERLFKPRATGVALPEEGELWLEIGAGKGLHALSQVQSYAHIHLIAIERTVEKYSAFQQRGVKEYKNLQAVHADAIPWCVFNLPPASLSQVYILYPNPEPHNPAQRWLNMPFFEFLLSRLKPNGKIILASNIVVYIKEVEDQLNVVWRLPYEKRQVIEKGRTHFEIKYLARGESCWQIEMVKPTDYSTRFDQWVAV